MILSRKQATSSLQDIWRGFKLKNPSGGSHLNLLNIKFIDFWVRA